MRQTYRTAAGIALLISLGWFLVYQLFARFIGMLFVAGDPLYLDACQHIFRFYMLAFFVYGLHMTTTSFFQSIGQPGKALALPVVRQAVVIIPLSIFLGVKFGLDGALLAVPVADLVSFVLSLLLVSKEFRRWRKQGWLA